MYIIDQHTKGIMEECKRRSRAAGLSFDEETLEYIVTNQDMIELSPKHMIPTLYDYWVNDVELLKGIGKYKLYPNNPYETVINSRPAISFYNDNNPDWLNVMIFYHVLGHIDFFQNNVLFENTWDDDFVGQALADKRLIASLRSEHGRWVDYAIEFSRNVDNLVGYFDGLAMNNFQQGLIPKERVRYFFDVFLQEIEKVSDNIYYGYIEDYNKLVDNDNSVGESVFFAKVKEKYPEFNAKFERFMKTDKDIKKYDIMEFIRDNSPFLNKEENLWIKSVLNIVRNTSMYFSPQIRTKIINEGWASYWHDNLFRADERISGHEIAYAKINSYVTSISRVGLNPYAIGMRLIEYVEELAEKGKLSWEYQTLLNINDRDSFDKKTGKGKEALFSLRNNFSDFTLINTFVNQEFVDKHDLFVVGKRLNQQRGTWEYYVKSRKAEDYKQMLIKSMYHPPLVEADTEKTNDGNLYLKHKFEGKELFKPYIADTLLGIEYLWGNQVQLETTEIHKKQPRPDVPPVFENRRVLYTIKDKKVSKSYI